MALNSTNTTELTQAQIIRVLTKPLEAKSQFLAAGPRIYDTAVPLYIPSGPQPSEIDGGTESDGFFAQGEQIAEVTPNFTEVDLMPSTMQSIKVLTKFSSELARQTVISLEAALRDRLVADVAAKIDATFLGVGGDGTRVPKGIFGWTGVDTIGTAGPLDLDLILDAHASALAQNNSGNLTLFLRPEQFIALRKVKDGDSRYMVQPDATRSTVVSSILGFPVVVSARIPDGSAALVDMSQIAVARDASPSVKILDQTFGDYDQVAVRVTSRYDAKPVNAKAVTTLTGITIPTE